MARDSGDRPSRDCAAEKSEEEQSYALRGHEPNKTARGRTECEPNSEFSRPPRDLQSEEAVNAD